MGASVERPRATQVIDMTKFAIGKVLALALMAACGLAVAEPAAARGNLSITYVDGRDGYRIHYDRGHRHGHGPRYYGGWRDGHRHRHHRDRGYARVVYREPRVWVEYRYGRRYFCDYRGCWR